jgi:hypothetical protein
MKIGFYGDSFCCETANPHSIANRYDTYITKIKKHYNANIVHLGEGGSSVWDVVIKQFNPLAVPDVCIFTWTDPYRVYHSKLRDLTGNSVLNRTLKDYTLNDLFYKNTLNAAREYFKHLYDHEKSQIEHQAALEYFDNNILSKVNSKIIHLYSFDCGYQWKNGITVNQPLIQFVETNPTYWGKRVPNHLNGEERNQKVFELIKSNLDYDAK